MIILDTNVLSEASRPRPSEIVGYWVDSHKRTVLFTTTICEAEIFLGVALLPHGRKREDLRLQATKLFEQDFAGRVLPFTSAAARAFAEIAAARRRAGRPIKEADAQIAAIARVHGAALATRDLADFEGCGVALIDPWAEAAI
jgi:hypothetical protein